MGACVFPRGFGPRDLAPRFPRIRDVDKEKRTIAISEFKFYIIPAPRFQVTNIKTRKYDHDSALL